MKPSSALRASGAAAVAALALLPTAASAATRPADTILRGGPIHTFDSRYSTVRALAVRNGRIVYAGGTRGVRRFVGRHTEVENLHGRAVMPGLSDAHIHVMPGGTQLVTCNLQYAALTTEQFQAAIQKCLDGDDGGPDDFLVVVNWYRQAMLPAGTDATKATLDALSTQRPIVVNSSDGHSELLNSKALQVAGITAATPDPATGRIDRDANGEPTGILEDSAQRLVDDKIPAPTPKDDQEALAAALKSLAAAGVTAVGDQQPSVATMDAYKALRKRGKLTVRVNAAPNVTVEQADAGEAAAVKALVKLRRRYETSARVRPRAGIRVRSAGELFQDGVLQAPAHTASLLAPYFDENGNPTEDAGPSPYWPDATLSSLLTRLVKNDFSPQVHAIGDRAVRATLDDYAVVRRRAGRKPRLAIAHAELVDPADYARFRRLDVTPVMSFQWGKPGPDSIEGAKVFMGPDRFDRMEPEGRLQHAGARIAYGSDWPVDALNEFFAIEVGITRRNDPASGYTGRLNSDPGLSRRESFRAITIHSAYEMGTERQTGSLVRGKLADYIVLATDPMNVRATAISDTKVLRTVVGGRTVFKR
jgi:predicted amidohydrolase YtcJ